MPHFNDSATAEKESGPLSGKRHNRQLPSDQDTLDDFQLHFTVISKASEDEVREMFLRLQMGVKLNAAEKRLNAVAPAACTTSCHEAANLPLFTPKDRILE